MIKFEEFRKSLGKVGDKMADDKIKELMEWEDKLAEVIFKQWLGGKNRTEQSTKTSILQPKIMLK